MGEIAQRGDRSRFARSDSYQFADEAAAEAYVKWRLSDDAVECARAGLERSWNTAKGRTVETYGVQRATDDGIFRGQYSREYDEQKEGEPKYSLAFDTHMLYRKGTMVLDAFVEQRPAQGDPENLADSTYNEVTAAMETVVGRLP